MLLIQGGGRRLTLPLAGPPAASKASCRAADGAGPS